MRINNINDNLLLGWPTSLESAEKRKSVYLSDEFLEYKNEDLAYSLKYEKDGHLVTFAPTGSGKGVSVIIPNLLHYSGPTIVIDPKGENFYVTASYRKKILKQRILLLDPFNSIDKLFLDNMEVERMSLNPLDLCTLSNNSLQNDAQMLADLLAGNGAFMGSDPYWDISARNLISGLIAHEMEKSILKKENQNLIISSLSYFTMTQYIK